MCQFHLIAIVMRALRKKHHVFLNERSEMPNEKGKYPELNIEKTTNRIEGLFKELKDKLRPHSGLTRKHKLLFIQDFLNKKLVRIIKFNSYQLFCPICRNN